MVNKYVTFVSDSDFLHCVKHVCISYPDKSKPIDLKKFNRNVIDPFKLVFDVYNGQILLDDWIKNEQIRQEDKTINNKIGEFHQKLLGKVSGWVDLGIGDKTKVDLVNDKKTIFIELKNKHNTMNHSDILQCRKNLEDAIIKYPNAKAYWAYIISKETNQEKIWIFDGKNDPKIKKICGKKVYELVTGDSSALEKVWEALPIAINDIIKKNYKITPSEQSKLITFFESAFRC